MALKQRGNRGMVLGTIIVGGIASFVGYEYMNQNSDTSPNRKPKFKSSDNKTVNDFGKQSIGDMFEKLKSKSKKTLEKWKQKTKDEYEHVKKDISGASQIPSETSSHREDDYYSNRKYSFYKNLKKEEQLKGHTQENEKNLVHNERTRLRPKIYLWSHLPETDDHKCRLPLDIDPWDQSVRQYLETDGQRRVVCPYENTTYDWTQTDENGIVRKKCLNCFCKYWVYRRRDGNDNKILWLDSGLIDDIGVDLKTINEKNRNDNHFLYVECSDKKSGQKYVNNHFWFVPRDKKISEKLRKRPSVLVLVVESLSRLNYLRHMQWTKQVFEDLGNVFYLRGLTKMADNSHPNMVPFLTGKTVDHFGGRYDKGPFDDYPFIWKQFERNGFQTALMEDKYDITLFNELEIGRKGFVKKQPVDWYPLSFWRQLISTDESEFEDYCYFDRKPRLDIFLDQLKHFVSECHNQSLPFFAFAFYIQVTHVRFNQAKTIDGHYSQWITQLRDILKDQFVIIMGDHGCRWGGGFLQTAIGRIEERMPLFGIHIPDSILSSNPHLSHYLIENRDRLTTWLDIHRMLEDISAQEFAPIDEQNTRSESYSLWRQTVPENRTCSEALIPQMYCVCDQRKHLDSNEPEVKKVALILVNKINEFLPELCHKLSVRVIITAEEITFHSSVTSEFIPKVNHLYELTVEVNPSLAIIRSQIQIFTNNTIKLDEEITRLNKYGNQSHCVSDSILRKICFCRDLL